MYRNELRKIRLMPPRSDKLPSASEIRKHQNHVGESILPKGIILMIYIFLSEAKNAFDKNIDEDLALLLGDEMNHRSSEHQQNPS